jgi:hypothetical protein
MTRLEMLRRRHGVVAAAAHQGSRMTISTARVPTAHASKYLQQLCKHWQHNLEVEFTPEAGTITFPREGRSGSWPSDGVARLTAVDDALTVTIEASGPEHAEAIEGVVARHLDRFAFREAPLPFVWERRED